MRVATLLSILLLVATACSPQSETGEAIDAPTDVETVDPASPADEPAVGDVEEQLQDSEQEEPNPGELEFDAPAEGELATECVASEAFPPSRTDVRANGNRIAEGALDLGAAPRLDVELPGDAEWIVPDPAVANGWYVSLLDGRAVRIDATGAVTDAGAAPTGPPELANTGEALSPFSNHALFEDPLPDSRVVLSGDVAVALVGPTDRLAHGVLGDAIEASAIAFVDLCTNEGGRIEIPEPDVIEGVAPLLADIDGDTELEILVTVSNAEVGARLVAYEFSGTILAESAPIGQGNRWRNQLAVAPFGLDGEVEIIDVRTPHIGGTVQAFALTFGNDDGPVLERVAASRDRYTSHVIGTGNLDMGLALDANADGRLDVVVPTADRLALTALTRTNDSQGWEPVTELGLDGLLTTNLASQVVDGRTTLAVGAGDVAIIWG